MEYALVPPLTPLLYLKILFFLLHTAYTVLEYRSLLPTLLLPKTGRKKTQVNPLKVKFPLTLIPNTGRYISCFNLAFPIMDVISPALVSYF
jgi:hypothetical protein